MKSNVQAGSMFEEEMVKILGKNGFWASLIPKDKNGCQPSDMIACNKKGVHLIDAKDCVRGKFVLDRIEDNQTASMFLIENRANGFGWFALNYPDGIYMIPYKVMLIWDFEGKRSISKIDEEYRLENWLREYRN